MTTYSITTDQLIGRGWSFPVGADQSGNIALVSGQQEIEQAIVIILLTAVGERVMRPTFGSRLHELVFEPNDATAAAKAKKYATEALLMWEPRIQLNNIRVEHDYINQGLSIFIDYQIKETNDYRSLVFPFYLIPLE